MESLGPEKALIFRIVHRDNVAWLLQRGLASRNGAQLVAGYVDIGDPNLIDKRKSRPVPIPPGGTLSDYVPFYFTPRSPMMFNIKTGHRGIQPRPNEEIAVLISSLHKLKTLSLPFLFTDRHASVATAKFSDVVDRLDIVDWDILRRSDFRRDNDDLGKFERYQAEALIFRHVPVEALLGAACCNEAAANSLRARLADQRNIIRVVARPEWYF